MIKGTFSDWLADFILENTQMFALICKNSVQKFGFHFFIQLGHKMISIILNHSFDNIYVVFLSVVSHLYYLIIYTEEIQRERNKLLCQASSYSVLLINNPGYHYDIEKARKKKTRTRRRKDNIEQKTAQFIDERRSFVFSLVRSVSSLHQKIRLLV